MHFADASVFDNLYYSSKLTDENLILVCDLSEDSFIKKQALIWKIVEGITGSHYFKNKRKGYIVDKKIVLLLLVGPINIFYIFLVTVTPAVTPHLR